MIIHLFNVSVGLSPQQSRICSLLFEGMTNAQIGEAIGLNELTIKTHLSIIGKKLLIDTQRYNVRVRIVYLMARSQGLIHEKDADIVGNGDVPTTWVFNQKASAAAATGKT